jgi:hypothetical protein
MDFTMMEVNYVFYDIQPYTSPRLVSFSLEERLEDSMAIFLADTHTVITDTDTEPLTVRLYDAR